MPSVRHATSDPVTKDPLGMNSEKAFIAYCDELLPHLKRCRISSASCRTAVATEPAPAERRCQRDRLSDQRSERSLGQSFTVIDIGDTDYHLVLQNP